MPSGFRYLGECIPITYYIRLSRQIILKGGGFEYVWKDTLAFVRIYNSDVFFRV